MLSTRIQTFLRNIWLIVVCHLMESCQFSSMEPKTLHNSPVLFLQPPFLLHNMDIYYILFSWRLHKLQQRQRKRAREEKTYYREIFFGNPFFLVSSVTDMITQYLSLFICNNNSLSSVSLCGPFSASFSTFAGFPLFWYAQLCHLQVLHHPSLSMEETGMDTNINSNFFIATLYLYSRVLHAHPSIVSLFKIPFFLE